MFDTNNLGIDFEKAVASLIFYGFYSAEGFKKEMFQNQNYAVFVDFISKHPIHLQGNAVQSFFAKNPQFVNLLYNKEWIEQVLLQIFSIEDILEGFLSKAASTLFAKTIESKEVGESLRKVEAAFKEVQDMLSKLSKSSAKDSKSISGEYKEYILRVSSMRSKGIIGIPSGIAELDAITKGFKEAEYTILAGRPSMGKTSLALDFAINAASGGKHVLFISLEMSRVHLVARALPKIEPSLSLANTLYAEDFDNVMQTAFEAGSRLEKMNFEIEAFESFSLDASIDMHAIRKTVESFKEKNGRYPDMVILDYIQQIKGKRSYDENANLSDISSEISSLRKKTGASWIVLSQLNREIEKRNNKRPMSSDLRGSGSLEQDADLIIFPFRPLVYKEKELKNVAVSAKNEQDREAAEEMLKMIAKIRIESAEIIVDKNRNGPTGSATVGFDRQRATFLSGNSLNQNIKEEI